MESEHRAEGGQVARKCREFVYGIVEDADDIKRNISGSGYSRLGRGKWGLQDRSKKAI